MRNYFHSFLPSCKCCTAPWLPSWTHLLQNVGWALVRCRDALAAGLVMVVSVQAFLKLTSGTKGHPSNEQHTIVSVSSWSTSSAPEACCEVFHLGNEDVQPLWWFHGINQIYFKTWPYYSNFIIATYFRACIKHLMFSHVILRVESILAWFSLAEQRLALVIRMKQTANCPFHSEERKQGKFAFKSVGFLVFIANPYP